MSDANTTGDGKGTAKDSGLPEDDSISDGENITENSFLLNMSGEWRQSP